MPGELINFVTQLKYRSLFKQIAIGVLGFIGTGIIIFLTSQHGAGITPDSVAYISAARNLTGGHGFLTYNGLPLIVQPPLYPAMLAAIKATVFIDPQIAAGYFNAVLFGLIIYLSGSLLLKCLNSFALVFLGTVSVLISFALVQASLMALSETLFIFLVLMFNYFFEKYKSKGSFVSFFFFSASAALACLTRYTGVVMILTGIICIILWTDNAAKIKWRHSFIFVLISVLPIGAWIIRNYLLSGTLVGQRAGSSYTLYENFKFFYSTVLPWYLPVNSTVIYLIFIVLIAAIWILAGSHRSKSDRRETLKLIGPYPLFAALYAGVIIISSTTTAYDQISDRLLSPVYIPGIFILFFVSDKILGWLKKFFNPKFVIFLFIIGIVMLIRYPLRNTVHIIKEYNEMSGWGYSSGSWKESETIGYLNRHKMLEKSYKLYSNAPEAVYILTNFKTKRSPPKTFYNSSQLFYADPAQKENWRNGENVCLVWFDNTNFSFLFTIDELQKKVNMTEVAHLKDGKIYTFTVK